MTDVAHLELSWYTIFHHQFATLCTVVSLLKCSRFLMWDSDTGRAPSFVLV